MKSNYRALFLVILSLLVRFAGVGAKPIALPCGELFTIRSGERCPADVTLTNLDTGKSRSMMTVEDGEYAFTSLPPGRYELKIRTRKDLFPRRTRLTECQRGVGARYKNVKSVTITLYS